jgi:uncharacterized membrane-anchored protein
MILAGVLVCVFLLSLAIVYKRKKAKAVNHNINNLTVFNLAVQKSLEEQEIALLSQGVFHIPQNEAGRYMRKWGDC